MTRKIIKYDDYFINYGLHTVYFFLNNVEIKRLDIDYIVEDWLAEDLCEMYKVK